MRACCLSSVTFWGVGVAQTQFKPLCCCLHSPAACYMHILPSLNFFLLKISSWAILQHLSPLECESFRGFFLGYYSVSAVWSSSGLQYLLACWASTLPIELEPQIHACKAPPSQTHMCTPRRNQENMLSPVWVQPIFGSLFPYLINETGGRLVFKVSFLSPNGDMVFHAIPLTWAQNAHKNPQM